MGHTPPCSHGVSPFFYASRLYRYLPITSPYRLDVGPFILAYALFIAIVLRLDHSQISARSTDNHTPTISSPALNNATTNNTESTPPFSILASIDSWSTTSLLSALMLSFVISLHILTCLACSWSSTFLCIVRFKRTHSIESATHISLQSTPSSYLEVAPIQRISGMLGFTYQHRKFVWSSQKSAFYELDFPVCHSRQYYISSTGLGHDDDDMFLKRVKYGSNAFDVPLPAFSTLFAEHATSPFFVFQVFCVGLWLLDEYWYYSLMTLCMLVLFEVSVVQRRIVSLEQVRSMRAASYDVVVFRSKKWRTVSTQDLLPGDILSLKRYSPSSGHHVPCDLVLIGGSCVVDESLLTGESIPQLKEPLSASGKLSEPLDIEGVDKSHILFGGTRVIVQSPPSTSRRPPDGGAIAYVLRTGFHTAQGRLVATMISSTDRVTVNTSEAFIFILLLLLFAVAAAAHVFLESWNDPNRSRSKLILNCVMIITSVVPPELPMELSLAVNVSLAALMKKRIFCTEPFRIPFAGAVDTICFDKTGTLTEDEFEFLGVAQEAPDNTSEDNGSSRSISPHSKAPVQSTYMPLSSTVEAASFTCRVIGSCHSLVYIDGNVVGDPLETAAVQSCNWQATPSSGGAINMLRNTISRETLRIVRRFTFESALRRMTCIVTINNSETIVVCKGAAESILALLGNIPSYYEATHRHYSRQGCRVLAMAYKVLQSTPINEMTALKVERDEVERNLVFAGFMVLDSPIKARSMSTVHTLQSSSHHVVMITGDHALTACEVARRLNITLRSHQTYILTSLSPEGSDDAALVWVPVSEPEKTVPYSPSKPPSNKSVSICITGNALQHITNNQERSTLILQTKIFARVNPEQKQLIVSVMKEGGRVTMMCGDGTNDVGALKQSHAGVALLTGNRDDSKPASSVHKRGRRARAELEPSQVASLGDASVAAPFTAKRSEVDCCLDIIRQGRCTLITTMQMYQILAIQCLISAYSLSVLYLDGVKLGDTQMTVTGVLVAIMFLFISRAKPLETLSAERPQSSVFTASMLLSLLGQFLIHLGSLMLAARWAGPYRPEYTDIDQDFTPNVLNTVVYLISTCMTVATFAANYKGHPFMHSIRENKAMWRCIVGSCIALIALCLEVSPAINQMLELHPFPEGSLRTDLVMLMIINFSSAIVYEHIVNQFFLRRSKFMSK